MALSVVLQQVHRILRVVAVVLPVVVAPGCVVATSSSNGDGGAFFLLLPAIVLLGVVIAKARRPSRWRRQRRGADAGASRPSRAMLRAEVSVLADDVVRLEPRVALCEAARDDFDAATQRYRVAEVALNDAGDDLDLVRLQRLVDEATWSMSRARALLDGRRPPEPSSTLQRQGVRGEPPIQLDEYERPRYVGSPSEFRAGWFGVGGGLFSGLLLGTTLLEDDGWENVDAGPDLDSDLDGATDDR